MLVRSFSILALVATAACTNTLNKELSPGDGGDSFGNATMNNSLIIAAGALGSAITISDASSPALTVLDSHDAVGGTDYSTVFAYYVQPTAGSISSEWAWGGGSGAAVASITVFKPGP